MTRPPIQYSREALKKMNAAEILAARDAGQLDDISHGGTGNTDAPRSRADQRADQLRAQAASLEQQAVEMQTRLTRDDIRTMYASGRHADIAQANRDGRIDPTTNNEGTRA